MALSRLFRLVPILAAGLLALATPASATALTVLHSFCTLEDCLDGQSPTGTLLMDTAHNLYGTTPTGGAHGGGVVFELLFLPSTGKYHYKVLYNFCLRANCADGQSPIDNALILDTSGNIYGTTKQGGSALSGTVFRLVPNSAHTRYTLETIYNFCEKTSGCEDGAGPSGGLTYAGASTGVLYDGQSSLFGSTEGGGRRHFGTAYSLTPNLHSGTWIERVLYFFCTSGQDCTDGKQPKGTMVVDRNGNLIGTTLLGGTNQNGVVFKLVPTVRGHWAENVLYRFCASEGCADGASPETGVIIDSVGSVYGTTSLGGVAGTQCAAGCGTIFKITPNGTESQLYAFCSQTDCTDGGKPAGLVMNASGNIYGVTNFGGTDKHGTIFSFNAGAQAVLFNIKCKHGNDCRLGETPTGSLVENSAGDFFGMLTNGGHFGQGGTVVQFTP